LAYRGIMPKALGRVLCASSSAGVEAVTPSEEHAVARQVRNVADEARARSACLLAAGPAIQVTGLLLYGLRKLRSEHARRVTAIHLLRLRVLAQIPPAPAPAAAAPLPNPPARGALNTWMVSDDGLAALRQMRWAALTPAQLIARLRMAIPALRVSASSAISALADAGVLQLRESELCWGPSWPLWSSARARLQTACSCPDAHHAALISLCATCGGTRLPLGRPISRCRWCGSASGVRCHGCGCAIHYRDTCRSWNQGAHAAYRPLPHEARWVCPDCAWRLVKDLARVPVGTPGRRATGSLLTAMEELAERVRPGAGAVVVQARRSSLRHLRKRTLAFARSVAGEFSMVQLATSFSRDPDPPWAYRADDLSSLRDTLHVLVQEGLLRRRSLHDVDLFECIRE
jgi:hypothetical protein